MTYTHTYSLRAVAFAAALCGVMIFAGSASAETYNPTINPADFSTNITNKYFSLPDGFSADFKGETPEGTETIKTVLTGKTKEVIGVETVVYHDTVKLDGVLIEDTYDYLAQDKEGNVWYFGEDSKSYKDGKYVDSHGSWTAGVDGAEPGIWMKANPKVGEVYRQEYLKGSAEDQGKILSLSETVTVPTGTYKNCLKTLDFTELDRSADEYKFYCPDVKGFTLEVEAASGDRTELVATLTTAGSLKGHGEEGIEDEDGADSEDADEVGDINSADKETINSGSTAQVAQLQATLVGLLKQLLALLMQQRGM